MFRKGIPRRGGYVKELASGLSVNGLLRLMVRLINIVAGCGALQRRECARDSGIKVLLHLDCGRP